MEGKEKIHKVEDITWVWDNTQGEEKASFFEVGNRTEIHLTKNKYDKYFTPNLESTWISFKPHRFNPQDLDIFARFKNTYYQQQAPDCWGGMLMFSFGEQDEIIQQEGKWIKIKAARKQPTMTQLKDFMF